MEIFKLENVWVCKLAYVYRRKPGDIMILEEENAYNFLLIMKENKSPNEVINLYDYKADISRYPSYFSLSGDEFYHGTQKAVFLPSDLGKIFVTERHRIPEKLLTDEEKESNRISVERIQELSKKVKVYRFEV